MDSIADSSPDPMQNISLLPDVIYRKLRLDILTGVLEPGQNLRQEELAKDMQVSRVPLREAMSRLQADGLILLRPRRGYIVNALDRDKIAEVLELLMVLEEHSGAVAARERTDEDIRKIEGLIAEMAALEEKAPNFVQKWSHLNREFHAQLSLASHRTRVAHIAGTLRDSIEIYILRADNRSVDYLRSALEEHRHMLDALKAADAKTLSALCRKHVEGMHDRLMEKLGQNSILTK